MQMKIYSVLLLYCGFEYIKCKTAVVCTHGPSAMEELRHFHHLNKTTNFGLLYEITDQFELNERKGRKILIFAHAILFLRCSKVHATHIHIMNFG